MTEKIPTYAVVGQKDLTATDFTSFRELLIRENRRIADALNAALSEVKTHDEKCVLKSVQALVLAALVGDELRDVKGGGVELVKRATDILLKKGSPAIMEAIMAMAAPIEAVHTEDKGS